MTRREIIGALAVSASLTVTGCNSLYSEIYRYRMTVEVETPEGLKSASSVIEARAWDSNGILGHSVGSKVLGQAVAVDMPNGTTLFALLKGVDGKTAAFASAAYNTQLPENVTRNPDWRAYQKALSQQKNIAILPIEHYPVLVRFADLNDPRTAEAVDPRNLVINFGQSVRIRRIFVNITTEPVTKGIDKRLPWLANLSGSLMKRPREIPVGDMPLAGRLTADDFWQGERA